MGGDDSRAFYLRAVHALPRPTPEQITGFVSYLSDAHSWYKHLPLMPPGAPFYVFVHPKVREGKAQDGMHYADWSTERYRKQCGYLDYRCGKPADPAQGLVLHRPGPPDFALQGNNAVARPVYYEVPEEVLRAGRVNLTGLIHQWAYQPTVLGWLMNQYSDFQSLPSEECAPIADIMWTLYVMSGQDDSARQPDYDRLTAELKKLFAKERVRQQGLIETAVRRMLSVVYES